VIDHPLDRRHQHPPHGKEQKPRRQDRNHRRQSQNAEAVVKHRRSKGFRIHRDLDQEPRLLDRIADHPDHMVLRPEQAFDGIADQLPGGRIAQVIGRDDLGRNRRGEDKFPHLVPPEDDVVDFGIVQQFLLDPLVDHVPGRQKRQRSDLRPFQTRQDIVLAKARDGGHEDQHLGQHHEDDRQKQEPPRERVEKHERPFRSR